MKHIYFIYRESQSLQYGVGTYINQLKMLLSSYYTLSFVVLFADTAELSTKKENDGTRVIKIPTSACYNANILTEECGHNIAYVLKQYMNPIEEIVFHFNYAQDYTLLKQIKVLLPNATTVLTVHCLSWGLLLKGNWEQFRTLQKEMETSLSKDISEFKTYWKQEKIMLDAVDKVICLCEATKNFINVEYKIPTDKLVVKPNVLQDIVPYNVKGEKKDFKFDETERIILYVGRIEEYKGIGFVIEAFRSILQQLGNARLVIVGDGDYQYCLQQCHGIYGKVTLTGRIGKEQLSKLYQIAEFGILLSAMEQCSYVCIEMMMHSLPLIVTDVMGLNEMVDENINGFKIPVTYTKCPTPKMEKLETCMLSLLKDEKLRLRFSAGSRSMYEQKYKACFVKDWHVY